MALGTTLKIAFDGNQVKRGLTDMKSGMKSVAKTAAVAAAGVAAIGAALIYSAKKAIDLGLAINKMGEAANTAEAKVSHVAHQIGIFGDEAGSVADRLNALADTTARLVGVDNKAIKSATTMMLTFKGLAQSADTVGGVFDRTLMATLDLAAAEFGTVESNAVAMGKALEDPIRGIGALSKNGVTFTAQEREKIKVLVESNRLMEAQGMILDAVEGQVGGTARATADASEQVNQGIQQMRESFAMGFSGAFQDAGGMIEPFMESIMEPLRNIGQRIGDSIRAAFQGNAGDLVKIGETAGGVIAKGIWVGIKNAFISGGAGLIAKGRELESSFLQSIGIGGVAGKLDSIRSKIGVGTDDLTGAASGVLKRDIEDTIRNAQIAFAQLSDPGSNPNRVRLPGGYYEPMEGGPMDGDLWINNQAHRLLERIADNTQPSTM